jgi:hypothetical protein
MTSMTRWTGSTDPEDASGTATYAVGATIAAIRLDDFQTAQLIERLIDTARMQGAAQARRAAAEFMRGAAANLEQT